MASTQCRFIPHWSPVPHWQGSNWHIALTHIWSLCYPTLRSQETRWHIAAPTSGMDGSSHIVVNELTANMILLIAVTKQQPSQTNLMKTIASTLDRSDAMLNQQIQCTHWRSTRHDGLFPSMAQRCLGGSRHPLKQTRHLSAQSGTVCTTTKPAEAIRPHFVVFF